MLLSFLSSNHIISYHIPSSRLSMSYTVYRTKHYSTVLHRIRYRPSSRWMAMLTMDEFIGIDVSQRLVSQSVRYSTLPFLSFISVSFFSLCISHFSFPCPSFISYSLFFPSNYFLRYSSLFHSFHSFSFLSFLFLCSLSLFFFISIFF